VPASSPAAAPGGYEIVKQNNDFVFKQPDGDVTPRALAQQFADVEYTEEMLAIEREHAALGLMIDAGTAVTLWDGRNCDYDLAVEGLLSMEPGQGDLGPRFSF